MAWTGIFFHPGKLSVYVGTAWLLSPALVALAVGIFGGIPWTISLGLSFILVCFAVMGVISAVRARKSCHSQLSIRGILPSSA